jgi:hypothetical protein
VKGERTGTLIFRMLKSFCSVAEIVTPGCISLSLLLIASSISSGLSGGKRKG